MGSQDNSVLPLTAILLFAGKEHKKTNEIEYDGSVTEENY